MKNNKNKMFFSKSYFRNICPLVIFSFGLIVGASIVALIFFYRLTAPDDYQSASLKYRKPSFRNVTTQSIGGPQPTVSIGGPQPTMGGPQPTVFR